MDPQPPSTTIVGDYHPTFGRSSRFGGLRDSSLTLGFLLIFYFLPLFLQSYKIRLCTPVQDNPPPSTLLPSPPSTGIRTSRTTRCRRIFVALGYLSENPTPISLLLKCKRVSLLGEEKSHLLSVLPSLVPPLIL